MAFSNLLVAAAYVPRTLAWSPKVAIVMIICNILAIAIANYVASRRNDGGASANPSLAGIGLPNLIGGACFGHILGAGAILGLAYSGVL